MGFRRIHHVGVVVEDLQRAIDQFSGFGLTCSEVRHLKDVGLTIGFFPVADDQLELLCYEPPRRETVSRNRVGVSHICFEVDDLDAAICEFEVKGAELMQGFPRVSGNSRIAFSSHISSMKRQLTLEGLNFLTLTFLNNFY